MTSTVSDFIVGGTSDDNHETEIGDENVKNLRCQICIVNHIMKLEHHKIWRQNELDFLRMSQTKYTTAISDLSSQFQNEIKQKEVFIENQQLEQQLQQKLDRLKQKKANILHLQDKISEIIDNLSKSEDAIYKLRNNIHLHLLKKIESNNTEIAKKNLLEYEYSILSKTNVWNDLFSIFIGDDYGIINGSPLGITLTPPGASPWTLLSEKVNSNFDKQPLGLKVDATMFVRLNAAFGACVLLLYCLTKHKMLKLKYYQPMPFGRQSYFIDENKVRYNLFGSIDEKNWKVSLNNGVKAFMVCLKEIELHLKIKVPGVIDLKKESISGYKYYFPDKIDSSTQTNWNKACRYILSNLKVLMMSLK